MFDVIKKTPGISYNEIARETSLSNGVVSHYLIKLMDSGEVEKDGTNRGKYFLRRSRILVSNFGYLPRRLAWTSRREVFFFTSSKENPWCTSSPYWSLPYFQLEN